MHGPEGLVDAMAHPEDPRVTDKAAWLRGAAACGITDVVCAGVEPGAGTLAGAWAPRGQTLRAGAATAAHAAHASEPGPPPDADMPPLLAGAAAAAHASEPGPPDADMPRLSHAVGLHPRWVRPAELAAQLQAVEQQLRVGLEAAAGKIGGDIGSRWAGPLVAVGEIGLDGRDDSPPAAAQEEAFRHQLRLAQKHALPLIIHCVHRIGRLIEILEEHGGAPHGAVLHGFGGPRELIERLVALNVSLGFGGLLLNPKAIRCHAAAVAVPDDRLLVETDAPELAPEDLPRLVETLATLRNTTPAAIAALTSTNARRLYGMSTLNTRSS